MTAEVTPEISQGQLAYLAGCMSDILRIVPPGMSVAIEGTPVYLDKPWTIDHSLGYNCLVAAGREILLGKARKVEHVVLLDDYSVENTYSVSEYLSRIKPPIDRIERESSFVPTAEELKVKISGKELRRSDGRRIPLTTPSGRHTCALLDAVFQATKAVDYNIIVHPIGFSHEQEEMRVILQEAKGGSLPFTIVNIFLKKTSISKVYVTSPEGRTDRVEL